MSFQRSGCDQLLCRACCSPLNADTDQVIDLGSAPPSNAFLRRHQLAEPEAWLPLALNRCPNCSLVQVSKVHNQVELFGDDYVYFSSYSSSWLKHAKGYAELVVQRLSLNRSTPVFEVASNDGYLLQYIKAHDIPCLGIEPTASTARAARERGILTESVFLGAATARKLVATHGMARLVLGNNVLAHVPDINDFVIGLRTLLESNGTLTLEFPHLLQLVTHSQFDTIYHEHYSYLSLRTVQQVLNVNGLVIWDADKLETHGGSLRIWAKHVADPRPVDPRVAALLAEEDEAGMGCIDFYRDLQRRAEAIKDDLLTFLIEQKRAGRTVAGYGAAAKGNTLLNYSGVRPDLLPFVVDSSPHKQGCWLPGSRIPVLAPIALQRLQPKFVLVLPWNLRDEIEIELRYIGEWGGRIVTAVPRLRIG
jgi:hypothetical protein